MPYIKKDQRDGLDYWIPVLLKTLLEENGTHPGGLNYVISKLLHGYIEHDGLSYANINKVMGVLDCASKEFYRTVAGPYESKQRIKNGPISGLDAKSLEDVR